MRIAALIVAAGLVAACSTPITAVRVGPDAVFKSLNRNALTRDVPSFSSRLALHRTNLTDEYESDPRAALAKLHRVAIDLDRRERMFALAELSLLAARRTGDRDLDVAAATYAFLYLFGEAEDRLPNGFDRRFRLACEIYNRALADAFRTWDGRWVPREGTYRLPLGSVTIELPDTAMHIGAQSFDDFRPCADYEIRGMAGRLHQSGLGAALIAGGRKGQEAGPTDASPGVRVAGSAFLEVLGELDSAESPGLRAVLSLHTARDRDGLPVRGRTVPLEIDATTPLAYALKEPRIWDFELDSFFSPDSIEKENGLLRLTPYERGKIPLVFIHGTASSPARWAAMINELADDDVIRRNYSAWLFFYKTSAPILLSAATLRQTLEKHIREIDPEGADEALRRMVVIGHSQGGLLTRLAVSESGDRFWNELSDRPFDELKLPPDELEEARRALFFEPLPFVERVIFVATPHQGSFLSQGLIRTISNALISIPRRTLQLTTDAVKRNVHLFRPDVFSRTPTAIDNMSPGHPFLQALAEAPMAARVHKHSIIPVTDTDPPLEERDDGVVEYTSAHLDGVDSERVVRSGHSVQENPDCIVEVRRILREHIGVNASGDGAR